MSAVPKFEIAPLSCLLAGETSTVFATTDQLEIWASAARAGDEFAYVTRCTRMLPAKSPIAALARDLAERGMVALVQRPIEGGARNYVAQRTRKQWREPGAGAPFAERVSRFATAEAAAIDALQPLLERCARFGRPCPTDAQLSQRTGIPRDEIRSALAAMDSLGIIRVAAAPAPTLRQITIVATGHRTGMVG